MFNRIYEIKYHIQRSIPVAYFMAYCGIAFVFIYGFNLRVTGDTVALINGIKEAVRCIETGQTLCTPSVGHFPIFQYLLGLPFVLLGITDGYLLKIFSGMSVLWFLVSIWVFREAGRLATSSPAGGHLGVLLILSGYLTWYATATFNESAAFALLALLTLGVLQGWRTTAVAFLAFSCTLTKEVVFPFVAYFMMTAFLAKSHSEIQSPRQLAEKMKKFVIEYWPSMAAIFLGVIINSLFNLFRFGTIKNASNLDPSLHTPLAYVPEFLYYLFFSPAGGLFYVWFSLMFLLLAPHILRIAKGGLAIVLTLAGIGVLGFNLGLSMWYSPFGWYAWGPRLTLPILGAVGVILVFVVGRLLAGGALAERNNSIVRNILYVVFLISALPNFAVMINEGTFFASMFAPTKIAIASGIKPFIVQTTPAELYMSSAVEGLSREIIVSKTLYIVGAYWGIFLVLGTAFYFVVKSVLNSLVVSRKHVHQVIDIASNSVTPGGTHEFRMIHFIALIALAIFIVKGDLLSFITPSMVKEATYSKASVDEIKLDGIEGFPKWANLYEVNVKLKEDISIDAVSVVALPNLGQWTTVPSDHLWNVALANKGSGLTFLNKGARRQALGLAKANVITLLLPDNGSLGACPDLRIELVNSHRQSYVTNASCKVIPK